MSVCFFWELLMILLNRVKLQIKTLELKCGVLFEFPYDLLLIFFLLSSWVSSVFFVWLSPLSQSISGGVRYLCLSPSWYIQCIQEEEFNSSRSMSWISDFWMKLAGMTQNPHTLVCFAFMYFHLLSCTGEVARWDLGYPVVSQMTKNFSFSLRPSEVLCPFTERQLRHLADKQNLHIDTYIEVTCF